jgi:hypothetical protein
MLLPETDLMPTPEDYAAKRLAELIPIAGAAPRVASPQHSQPDPTRHHPQKSTGPRTEQGKHRSSQNAIRHGLSGRIVVLPTEDISLYLEHSKKINTALNPQTPIEEELAQTVADGYWRMKHLRTVEEGMFAWTHYEAEGNFDAANENTHSAFTAAAAFRAHSQAFVNLSIYEQRIQRGIDKAMKQLQELQAERKARREEVVQEAIRLRQYQLMMAANNPEHPDAQEPASGDIEFGEFVCSVAGTDSEIVLRTRLAAARRAEKSAFNYEKFLATAA